MAPNNATSDPPPNQLFFGGGGTVTVTHLHRPNTPNSYWWHQLSLTSISTRKTATPGWRPFPSQRVLLCCWRRPPWPRERSRDSPERLFESETAKKRQRSNVVIVVAVLEIRCCGCCGCGCRRCLYNFATFTMRSGLILHCIHVLYKQSTSGLPATIYDEPRYINQKSNSTLAVIAVMSTPTDISWPLSISLTHTGGLDASYCTSREPNLCFPCVRRQSRRATDA